MKRKINWLDLPTQKGLFTARSTSMVNLDVNVPIQFYSANTKINVVQYAIIGEEIFFRTQSAKQRDLNWAIKATAFRLPDGYIASFAPNGLIGTVQLPSYPQKNKHLEKTHESSKSEGSSSVKKIIRKIFRKK